MDYEMEELLPIVTELVNKYTGNESTSVTYEKAQTLMEAVFYCLNEYLNSNTNSIAHTNISLKEQYDFGFLLLSEKVDSIRKMFNELSVHFEDYGVKCLNDTIQKGIPEFLKWYDIKFRPQDTILTLDYPLLSDYSSLTGADKIYVYVKDIQMEQLFLKMFGKDYVTLLLENYDPNYCDMLENICSIVLINTIGHIAVQKPFQKMGFLKEEYQTLSELFEGKTVSDIESIVQNCIKQLTAQFFHNNTELYHYLCCEARNTAVRIHLCERQGKLNNVFIL